MKQVRDGSRTLQFEGELLGESSSWRPGANRWVEFKLYKTTSGSYVLSRIGETNFYHHPECVVVKRNYLKEVPTIDVKSSMVPCPQCRPRKADFPFMCPETPRYWAQVCTTPSAVREALYKVDEAGNRYLTSVAQRLLDDVSYKDKEIADIYDIETID